MKKQKISLVRRLFGWLCILFAIPSILLVLVDVFDVSSSYHLTRFPSEQVGAVIWWTLLAVWAFGGFRFLSPRVDAQPSQPSHRAQPQKRAVKQQVSPQASPEDEPWRY